MATMPFPTLDLAELDDVPLVAAVAVRTVERREFGALLSRCLPTVVYARRPLAELVDQYEFVDEATGAAVRYVLSWDPHYGQYRGAVATTGVSGLFERLVTCCDAWERDCRPDPDTWQPSTL